MRTRLVSVMFACTALFGCGDKVPESEAAKKLGNAPKAAIDRAASETAKALEKGAERNRAAERSKE